MAKNALYLLDYRNHMKIIIGIFFGLIGMLSAQTLNTQLKACYPFDGDAQNYASSANLLNGTTSSVTYTLGHGGTSNSAIHFDGTLSSYMTIPSDTMVKPKQLSVSGWFYADTIQNSYVIYTSNNCVNNDEAYALTYINNQFMAEMASQIDFCSRTQVYSAPVIAKTWNHVVFYMDTTIIKLYVNNVLTSQAHTMTWDYASGKEIVLANSLNPYLQAPFKGSIDNLRFYDRELTSAEVNQLYLNDPSCVRVLGVDENLWNNQPVSVYPNPSSQEVFITGLEHEVIYELRFYNSMGQLILEIKNQNHINVSNFQAGIYHLEILDSHGGHLSKKLIKE